MLLCSFRFTNYAVIIVKCLDRECCSEFRSDWLRICPNRFPSGPVLISNTDGVIKPVIPQKVGKIPNGVYFASFLQMKAFGLTDRLKVFNQLCPSLQKVHKNLVCPVCKKWYPSKATMLKHRRAIHPRNTKKLRPSEMTTGGPNDDVVSVLSEVCELVCRRTV